MLPHLTACTDVYTWLTHKPGSRRILLVLTCIQLVMSVMRVMIYYLEYGVLRCKRMLRTLDTPVLPSEYGGPRYFPTLGCLRLAPLPASCASSVICVLRLFLILPSPSC
jgi:hypothetical protein